MSEEKLTTRRKAVKDIELFIIRHSLKAGDGLPSERELSEILSASRRAVREALVALDAMGIVEIRPRSGCYLKAESIKKSINGESSRWFGDDISPRDIYQLRETLERESAVQAIKNASKKHLQKIDTAYKIFASNNAFIGGVEDRNFHLTIADAGGNILYERLLLEIWLWGDKYFLWDCVHTDLTSRKKILDIHNSIRIAIMERDIKGALESIHHHYLITNENAETMHRQFELSFIEGKAHRTLAGV